MPHVGLDELRASVVKHSGAHTAMSTHGNDPGAMRIANERRRSNRYPLVIPIHLKWPGLDGAQYSSHAQAREANLHGGLLEFTDAERYPPEGTEVELTNLISDHKTRPE